MNTQNVLFIFTDEQRYDTLKAYGNSKIRTPNIDALAESATVFDRAYCTQAVCTPSRASIMTGLFPHSCNVPYNNYPLEPQYKTLVEHGDFSSYKKGYYGKWHLGDEVFCQHGFDEWVSIEDYMYRNHVSETHKNEDWRCSYFHWLVAHGVKPTDSAPDGTPYFSRSEAAKLPEKLGKPAFLAEKSSQFITQNKANPFVLYVNFLEPHMPYTGPLDKMYSPEQIDLPPDFGVTPEEAPVPHVAARIKNSVHKKNHLGTQSPTEQGYRELIARYWGLVTEVDNAVGKILNTLKEQNLFDNTIIVFTSDHGDMMGGHGLLTKGVQYDGSTRIPLIIKHQNQRTQKRVEGPVSLVDAVPTLLDMLDQRASAPLDGKSLLPFIESGSAPDRPVIIEWNETGDITKEDSRGDIRTIITQDNWKLNYSALGYHELFNLNADPNERRNLISVQREKAKEMGAMIERWQEATDDKAELPGL